MSLDLSTLQERYPHGSRWDLCPPGEFRLQGIPLDRTLGSHDAVVCGWIDRWTEGGVVFDLGGGVFFAVTTTDVERSCVRHVPPPPCPITEPVALVHGRAQHWRTEPDAKRDNQRITLYPFVEGDVDDDGPYMKARWTS